MWKCGAIQDVKLLIDAVIIEIKYDKSVSVIEFDLTILELTS
jgi:hypothetical protein